VPFVELFAAYVHSAKKRCAVVKDINLRVDRAAGGGDLAIQLGEKSLPVDELFQRPVRGFREAIFIQQARSRRNPRIAHFCA
jgi:hypothetical protein